VVKRGGPTIGQYYIDRDELVTFSNLNISLSLRSWKFTANLKISFAELQDLYLSLCEHNKLRNRLSSYTTSPPPFHAGAGASDSKYSAKYLGKFAIVIVIENWLSNGNQVCWVLYDAKVIVTSVKTAEQRSWLGYSR
jgi:hypothetical protein